MARRCLRWTIVGLVVGCTEPQPAFDWQDVQPVLEARCSGCHNGAGAAPHRFEEYDTVVALAGAIKAAVRDGRMPPWQAAPGCQTYVDDRSLAAAEREALLTWLDDQTPLQVERETPRPVVLEERVRSAPGIRRDFSTTTPRYEVDPAEGFDESRCFLLDFPVESTRSVIGVEVLPGNLSVAHHVVVAYVEAEKVAAFEQTVSASTDGKPGYDCFGGFGGEGLNGLPTSFLGGWVPGDEPRELPYDMGHEVEPGGKLLIQMHYNNLFAAQDRWDETTVNLMYGDGSIPTSAVPILDPNWVFGGFNIAADSEETFTFRYKPTIFTGGFDIAIVNAWIHMHQLGKSASLALEHPDGSETCLLDIPRWDFFWQTTYWFEKPVKITSDDWLRITCTIDNTQANQVVSQGQQLSSQAIGWGGKAPDEMCAGLMGASLAIFVR